MYRALNHPILQPLLHHLLHHHGHEFRPPSPWPLADRGTPAPEASRGAPAELLPVFQWSGEAPLRASGSTCESPCPKEPKHAKQRESSRLARLTAAKRTFFSLFPNQMSVHAVSSPEDRPFKAFYEVLVFLSMLCLRFDVDHAFPVFVVLTRLFPFSLFLCVVYPPLRST